MNRYIFYMFIFSLTWVNFYGQQTVSRDFFGATLQIRSTPDGGLAKHDFFFAGEGNKVISIVRSGKVVWTYTDTTKHGEVSDAVLLINGNVLFTRQKGISLISADKKLLWNYNAPPNTEIHTAQAIGNDRIIYGLNGNPAKIVLANILTNKIELEFPVTVKNTSYVHGQFRHISLTNTGTVLVGKMDMDKVSEYDTSGNEIWSIAVPSPWYVKRLSNGNTLITSYKKFVREVNIKGEIVWEFNVGDLPGTKLTTFQCAIRLKNGNTLLSNSCAKGNGEEVQAIEVSKDKRLVWTLRSWGPDIDLGRSTTIQILDGSNEVDESKWFGKYR